MSAPPHPAPPSEQTRVSVLVCRGCCCGTDKHPDDDHDGQLRRLEEATGSLPAGRLYVVDCLGPCERSNVVVVRGGGTRRWFGEVLGDELTGILAGWIGDGGRGSPPTMLQPHLFDPVVSATVPRIRRAGTGGVELAAVVAELIARGAGAWTVGVLGAVAEFWAEPGRVDVRRDGVAVTAVSAEGALRLELAPEVAAFALSPADTDDPVVALVLAVPAGSADTRPVHHGVTILGPDPGALRGEERHGSLVDLGLGLPHHRFCLRSTDPELQRISAVLADEHAPWSELIPRAGALLVDPARSPHRVVLTTRSRAEVFSPIPPPGGVSPLGPHTHLLAGELELGRELPTGLELPAGWAPVATFHPPTGWQPPQGLGLAKS